MGEHSPKRIAILGSTGSIGRQALDVVESSGGRLKASVLTANHNAELLIEQAFRTKPTAVVICNEHHYAEVHDALGGTDIEVLTGQDTLEEVVARDDVDMVLAALVGFAGLRSTVKAIEAGKDVALANKETLVVAGDLIMNLARQHGVKLIPVDSEHSAIFQCLVGEDMLSVSRILITASGGPFRGQTPGFLKTVTREQALQHPTWSMGNKISIDSATLMNKGLEVIEAHWLFGLPQDRIEVVIHPQSVIHSMVYFVDGSVKAQLSSRDMRHAISYALSYPQRMPSSWPPFDWMEHHELTFEPVDANTFPCLGLARRALQAGGTHPCVLNAANEVAVKAFLEDDISFTEIPEMITDALEHLPVQHATTLDDYVQADQRTRHHTEALVSSRAKA